MSSTSTQTLVQKMKTDGAFRDRILSIDDVDERLAAVKAAGFECSAQDLAALKETVARLGTANMDQWNCCEDVPYYYR